MGKQRSAAQRAATAKMLAAPSAVADRVVGRLSELYCTIQNGRCR